MRLLLARPYVLLVAVAVGLPGALTLGAHPALAQSGLIRTMAGGPGEGPARVVGQDPVFVRVNGQSVLVADGAHQVLRRIDLATGQASVVAGIGGEFLVAAPGRPPRVTADDGGPATQAAFHRVGAFATAPDGTIYLADERRIRRIDPSGTISTAVGTGARRASPHGAETRVEDVTLAPVTGMAVDAQGRLWFAEHLQGLGSTGGTISRLDADGVVRLVVGQGADSRDGAAGREYRLESPRGLLFDRDGGLVFSDVREFSTNVLRYVPDQVRQSHSLLDLQVQDMAAAQNDDLLLAVSGRLVRLRPDGSTSTEPGTGQVGLSGRYVSVAVLPSGLPVMARYGGFALTTLDATDKEVMLAGDGSAGAAGDGGPATRSQLGRPTSLTRTPDGAVLVADQTANRVRRITPDGRMTTLVGTGAPSNTGDGGPAGEASVKAPSAVEAAPDGSIYIAARDPNNYFVIRKASPLGAISTYAGGGKAVEPVLDAREMGLLAVEAMAVLPDGSLLLISGCRILKIAPGPTPTSGGLTTVYAGGGPYDPCEDSADGVQARSARFLAPSGLAVSDLGDVYVSDAMANRVRRIDPSGQVHAFAGRTYRRGVDPSFAGDDGPATEAHLNHPAGLAVTAGGGVLIADQHNYRVREVRPDGSISTIAGGRYEGLLGDGGPAVGASLNVPRDVETGTTGEVYIAEPGSPSILYGIGRRRIRVVEPAAPTPAPSSSPSPSPTPSPSSLPPSPAPTPDATSGTEGQSVQPLSPARVLDTRVGTGGIRGRLVDGRTATFVVTGRGGVPVSGVRAVVLNVTVTGPLASGHLAVFPAGQAAPGTSSLNFRSGQTVPNLVMVPVGPGGSVSLRANAGAPHVLADIAGYVAETAQPEVVSLSPSRVLDSRIGTGGIDGRLAPGAKYDVSVLGRGGVPEGGVRAVLLNTTVTGANASGHLTVFPSGRAAPVASNLNYSRGQTVANLVLAGVGPDGRISLQSHAGSPFVVADVVGYVADPLRPTVVPLSPARVLDTRDGNGGVSGRLAPQQPVTFVVAGRGGVAATGVRAVLLNVTSVGASAAGHLTVYPGGEEPPAASNLNYSVGQTVANLVLVPVDSAGRVSVLSNAGGPHVLADVVGFVRE